MPTLDRFPVAKWLLKVTQGHRQRHNSTDYNVYDFLLVIDNNYFVAGIVTEISTRYLVKNREFFITYLYLTLPLTI